MTDAERTTESLKAEQAKIDVSQKLPVAEWQARWARIDQIEAELAKRGQLQYATYNE